MFFNYLNIVFEVTAHVFRAISACAILLPLSYFAGRAAFDLCNELSVVLGIISVSCAIMAAAAGYMELEQAVEEVRAFRYWRAAIQNA